MAYGEITDEGIAELRSRIGAVVRTSLFGGFNTEASVDTIRHFVDGIGDLNPVYRELEAALASGYPSLPAPPSFLFSIHPGFILQGLPGVHSLNGGHEWNFYLPILTGDRVEAEPRLKEVQERESRWAGRVVYQYNETTYTAQPDLVLGKVLHWSIRGERKKASQRGVYNLEPHNYSDAELAEIDQAYVAEEYRGAVPRYWEDVEVGEELSRIVRGPFSMSDLIAYYSGALGAKAHGIAAAQFRKHPGWAIKDPKTGVPVEPVRAHESSDLAKSVGVGRPYDIGGQRCSWGLSLLTNWGGNDAFVTYYYSQNRYPVQVGDTVWLGGRVTGKRIEGDDHIVECETWGKNQRDQDVLPGRALLALPSRQADETPVARRLRSRQSGAGAEAVAGEKVRR